MLSKIFLYRNLAKYFYVLYRNSFQALGLGAVLLYVIKNIQKRYPLSVLCFIIIKLQKILYIHEEVKMTEEKKIKIGKICSVISTVLFVLFFISVLVIPVMNQTFFLISTVVIVVLFSISCIVSHICLKDYKPQ